MSDIQRSVIDGEIVDAAGDLTAAEARALTDRIRGTLTVAHDLIASAYTGRAWVALGYDSWDAYCAGEFTEARMVRLEREQRREIVAAMRSEGMSTRAIASGIGVDRKTVREDIAQVVPSGPPEPIRGQDGKTYQPPAATPEAAAPPPKPRRNPLPDQARDAGWDLRRSVERLERLASDARFGTHKELMATHLRGHLTHAVEVCQDLLDRLPNEDGTR